MGDNLKRADDYYVWYSNLSWPFTGGLERAEWTDLGKKLFAIALVSYPLQLARATASDWLRAYDPDRCFETGFLTKNDANRYIHFLIDQDKGPFIHDVPLSSPAFCKPVYFANIILLGAALALTLLFFRRLDRKQRAALLVLWLALFANDFVFSFLSGMWGRYTVRGYGILVLIVLIALSTRHVRSSRSATSAADVIVDPLR